MVRIRLEPRVSPGGAFWTTAAIYGGVSARSWLLFNEDLSAVTAAPTKPGTAPGQLRLCLHVSSVASLAFFFKMLLLFIGIRDGPKRFRHAVSTNQKVNG